MADEIFFGPSIAIVGTIVALNCIYCCLGVRRIRLIEQRIHSLEERQTSIPTATATATTIDIQPQQMMYPPTTYAAPNPNYTYYQPQQQPTAPRYYPQDPQTLYR